MVYQNVSIKFYEIYYYKLILTICYSSILEQTKITKVMIPTSEEMDQVHRVIYDELCAEIIEQSSRQIYTAIIRRLITAGAQGIIIGCTEIGLLVKQEDSSVPLFDTTEIHASAAVRFALEG